MDIGIMEALQNTTMLIRNWTDKKKADKTAVDDISDKVNTINNKLETVPNDLVVLQGQLYLAKDGVPLEGTNVTLPEGGGGGGNTPGGDGSGIDILNKSPETIVVATGVEVKVTFFFAAAKSGDGKAFIYVTTGNGSKQLKGHQTIYNGKDNYIDLTPHLGEDINIVDIVCTDSSGHEESIQYTVEIISLYNKTNFNDSQVFTKENGVPMLIQLNGNITKTLHFEMKYPDEKVHHYTVDNIDTDNAYESYDLYTIARDNGHPLTHGTYYTKVYTTAQSASGHSLSSDPYIFDIMFSEGITTPLISSVYNVESVAQGERVDIPFTVFHATNDYPEVTLSIEPGEQNGKFYPSDVRTIDGCVRQIWSTKSYPLGQVTFVISYGGVSKRHTITVVPSEMKHSVKKNNIKFYLSAAGKSNENEERDIWNGVDANNTIVADTTFTNVNWSINKQNFTVTYTDDKGKEFSIVNQYAIGTGWTTDDNGDPILRLSGDAQAVINFKPYLVDPKRNGKTIELIFAIRDVNDRDAVAMTCMSNGVGFEVKPDTTVFTNGSTSAVCNYVDGERVHLTLVIEPNTDTCLFCAYINGVMSSASQYAGESESMHQSSPVGITVGSPLCSIDLYAIRVYDIPLTKEEVRNNFIADSGDVSISLENDIYHGTKMQLSSVEKTIPVMRITGEKLPSLKNDSKKEDYHVDVDYTDPFNPDLSFTDHALIHVQGTSSETYPRKNWKLEFDNAHTHMPGMIPSDVFCMKCDFAENTGSHNTANANFVHTLYGDCKTPPQKNDPRVRTTIAGCPCLIFYRKYSTDQYEFAGKYNFNYEKASTNAYGLTAEYPQAESWEFRENKELACQFLDAIPEDVSVWNGPIFEARYPDKNKNIENFRVMHNWVMSTNQDKATDLELNDKYVGKDGSEHTHDTAQYRLTKFKDEFEDYFELDFMLIYYVYTFVMLMVDQRAKNMFLTTWDQKRWAGWFYDNDTCLGINNEGKLVYDYYHQDYGINSVWGVQDVYNGKPSVLWTNFYQAFPDQIADTYDSWRISGNEKISYEKLVKYFITDHTDKWPISVYNEDSEFKYIKLLKDSGSDEYLYQVRGTGEEHFRYMVKNRLMFCDSKWLTGDFMAISNRIVLRLNTPKIEGKFAPDSTISYKTFSNMYAAVRYGTNTEPYHKYTPQNTWVSFSAESVGGAEIPTFKDTDTYIFGADQISYLGDLSRLYCSTINISAASKLLELNVGSDEEGYNNPNLKGLSFSNNRLLKKVNVCNCTGFTTRVLNFTLCPNIQEIYATGSNITGVDLPDGGYLKIAKLPASINTIKVVRQKHIQTFECASYANLTSIRIENSVNMPVTAILDAITVGKYPSVRIVNMDWSVQSADQLSSIINKLIHCKALDAQGLAIDSTAIVTGKVSVNDVVSDELRERIHQYFPDLIVVDNTGKTPYFIDYLKIDGQIFRTITIYDNETPTLPDENPSDIDLGDHRYIFTGWDMSTFKPNQNNRISGIWAEQYAIYFYNNEEHSQLYITLYSDVNEPPVDPVMYGVFEGALPADKIYEPTKTSHAPDDVRYKFNGWSNLPSVVTGVTVVYADFIEQYPVRFKNESACIKEEWVIKGQSATPPPTNPTKASTAQYDYKFKQWVGDYTNVTAPRDITAKYDSITRKYTVYFCNGDQVPPKVVNVSYGSTATYSGAPPIKQVSASDMYTSSDYEWTGKWDPEPIPTEKTLKTVSGETAVWCYPVFKFIATLGDTWDDIAYNVEHLTDADLFTRYPIGARKNLEFTIDGNTYNTIVEVIAHNHDNRVDDQGNSLGKAKLTFFTYDLPMVKESEDLSLQRPLITTRTVGWGGSQLRQYMNNDLFNGLPGSGAADGNLQSAIKQVSKAYNVIHATNTTSSIKYSNDKCWAASDKELALYKWDSNGNITEAYYPKAHTYGQGEVYSDTFSFEDLASRQKNFFEKNTGAGWWTRSLYIPGEGNTSNMAWYVWANGKAGGWGSIDSALTKYAVAFGFCI